MSQSLVVTVFGSGTPQPGDALYAAARELGAGIAAAGWTVCNGGYGGTMEATARGAAEAGGHTIGVTCRALTGRCGPNRFVQEEVATETLYERLQALVQRADAYVVLPGGTGTLLELALLCDLRHKRLLPPGKPVIVDQDAWQPILAHISSPEDTDYDLQSAATVAEMLAALRRMLSRH